MAEQSSAPGSDVATITGRDDVRPDVGEGLGAAEDRGRLTIADRVVERIATLAAGEVSQTTTVDGALARVVRGRLPRVSATVAGRTARLEVEVAVGWGTPLSEVAATVRDHVGERVTTLSGVQVTAVDVTVAEIVRRAAPPRRVE